MPSKSIEELKAEAERLFVIPKGACPYVIARTLWKRERWVKEQLTATSVV